MHKTLGNVFIWPVFAAVLAASACSSGDDTSKWRNANPSELAIDQSPIESPTPMPKPTPTGASTGLPEEIRQQLDDEYPGWKAFKGDPICKSKAVVSGRFNGDGTVDYAVMFKQDRRGYVLAFLSGESGSGYRYQVLEDMSSKDLNGFYLFSGKKGERFGEIIDDDFNRAPRKLQYDAPGGGSCEGSGFYWIYKNGKFKPAFFSD